MAELVETILGAGGSAVRVDKRAPFADRMQHRIVQPALEDRRKG